MLDVGFLPKKAIKRKSGVSGMCRQTLVLKTQIRSIRCSNDVYNDLSEQLMAFLKTQQHCQKLYFYLLIKGEDIFLWTPPPPTYWSPPPHIHTPTHKPPVHKNITKQSLMCVRDQWGIDNRGIDKYIHTKANFCAYEKLFHVPVSVSVFKWVT